MGFGYGEQGVRERQEQKSRAWQEAIALVMFVSPQKYDAGSDAEHEAIVRQYKRNLHNANL